MTMQGEYGVNYVGVESHTIRALGDERQGKDAQRKLEERKKMFERKIFNFCHIELTLKKPIITH